MGLPSAARWAPDVFVIQSQADEFTPDAFRTLVQQASAQARAANASVKVFAEISTEPINRMAKATELATAVRTGRPYVNGFSAEVFAGRSRQLAIATSTFSAFR